MVIAIAAGALAPRAMAKPEPPARVFPLQTADGWRAAGQDGVRGITIGPIENGYHPGVGYGSAAYGRTLDECKKMGARWVAITPFGRVLDLSGRVRTTAYEHPESLKERTYLVTGGDYWPYATSTSRHVDYDHPTPYDDHGPPGQTGSHNSGPLGRRHHRWKTHAGYRSRQCGEGRYVWITPHGLSFLVDHRGTRPIERAAAETMYAAPPGLDLYVEGA